MMQFSITQLERLVAEQGIEKGGSDDTEQTHSGITTSYNPPKLERDIRRQIYDVLHTNKNWMSRAEIAKALSLKKTEWLNNAIESLVHDGYIVKTETAKKNGMKHFWYGIGK